MKKKEILVLCCIYAAALLGFMFGYICSDNKWQDMYDRHINEQQQMLEQRDSLYLGAIDYE